MEYYRWNDDMITEEEWLDIVSKWSENYRNYCEKERKRINTLDEADRQLQMLQLIRVMDEMIKLEILERERNRNEIKKQLKSEGVVCKECMYTSDEIKSKWQQAFLSHITKEEKEEWYIDMYLWHAFTYGKEKMAGYLEGDDARKAFDNEIKDKLYIFWQGEEQVYYLATNNKLRSKHLRFDMGLDIYVVDSNFTWTFLYKHCDKTPIWYKKKK